VGGLSYVKVLNDSYDIIRSIWAKVKDIIHWETLLEERSCDSPGLQCPFDKRGVLIHKRK
jgi:hypothetical protein